MIYTVTFNPSIDYVIHLEKFTSGLTNRTTGEAFFIGGKGINVSYILSQIGLESTALGFTAGFTGEAIERGVKEMGIHADLIRLKEGVSRINIKMKAGEETEINGQGPRIPDDALRQLFDKIDTIHDNDTIVLAGSIPDSLPDDTYERILQRLTGKNVRIVVDAAKKLLLNCLPYRPFLIKPNRQELSEIFGCAADRESEIKSCAEKLLHLGARNVIVSLGAQGAVLFTESGKIYQTGTVKEKVQNTVGAGDSMIAGFIAGFEQTGDYAYALRLGAACGNATACSPGLATKQTIDEMFQRLETF